MLTAEELENIKKTGIVRLSDTESIPITEAYKMLMRLRNNPDLYLQQVLGVEYLAPKMQEAIRHIPDNKYTLIKAGHGVSKSFSCAGLIPWWLETHPQSLVATTAPTNRQVSEVLWREVGKHRGRSIYPIAGKQLKNRLKLAEDWQGFGFSSNQGVSYQGLHEEYLLWIIDEADGIPRDVWEAIMSTLTGTENRLVAIGNPVDPDSQFREEIEKHPEDVFTIPSYESPNIILDEKTGEYISDEIIPGCATLEWINEVIEIHSVNSNYYKSRVIAEYPDGSPDTLLTREQILKAAEVDQMPAGWFVVGVDVAYDGNDESAITALSGNAFYDKYIKVQGLNGEALAQKVMDFIKEIEDNNVVMNEDGIEVPMRCKCIIWDAAGVATAFTEFIYKEISKAKRLLDINLQPIDFAGKVTESRVEAQENDMHMVLNKRAEMYMDFKRLVVTKKLYIPKAYNVYNIFAKIKYFTNKQSLTQIESKQEFKKKNKGKSPDMPDSMILAVHAKVLRLYLSNKQSVVN